MLHGAPLIFSGENLWVNPSLLHPLGLPLRIAFISASVSVFVANVTFLGTLYERSRLSLGEDLHSDLPTVGTR